MDQLKADDPIVKNLSDITRIDPSGITADTLIAEELGIDSLLSMEIIARVEKHFSIEIDEALLIDVATVGDFVEVIRGEIAKQNRT